MKKLFTPVLQAIILVGILTTIGLGLAAMGDKNKKENVNPPHLPAIIKEPGDVEM